jgi:hypothetical protein
LGSVRIVGADSPDPALAPQTASCEVFTRSAETVKLALLNGSHPVTMRMDTKEDKENNLISDFSTVLPVFANGAEI